MRDLQLNYEHVQCGFCMAGNVRHRYYANGMRHSMDPLMHSPVPVCNTTDLPYIICIMDLHRTAAVRCYCYSIRSLARSPFRLMYAKIIIKSFRGVEPDFTKIAHTHTRPKLCYSIPTGCHAI